MSELSKEVNLGGRPQIVLDADQIEIVEKAAAWMPNPMIANLLKISAKSFVNIRRRQPEVQVALDYGRSIVAANVGKSLYKQALKGNVQAIKQVQAILGVGPASAGFGADDGLEADDRETMTADEYRLHMKEVHGVEFDAPSFDGQLIDAEVIEDAEIVSDEPEDFGFNSPDI